MLKNRSRLDIITNLNPVTKSLSDCIIYRSVRFIDTYIIGFKYLPMKAKHLLFILSHHFDIKQKPVHNVFFPSIGCSHSTPP